GQKCNFCFRQLTAYIFKKILEIIIYFARRFSSRKVIVTYINYYLFGFVRIKNTVSIIMNFIGLRSTETTINRLFIRKIFIKLLPSYNGRSSYKDNRTALRLLNFIRFFESNDI